MATYDPSVEPTNEWSENFTMVPNVILNNLGLFDSKEVCVLNYIVRRTFGFQKQADQISIDQFVSGLTKWDGTQLDLGTGLSRRSVQDAISSLEQKGVLIIERRTGFPNILQIDLRGFETLQRRTRPDATAPEANLASDLDQNSPRRGVQNLPTQKKDKKHSKKSQQHEIVQAESRRLLSEAGIQGTKLSTLAKDFTPEEICQAIELSQSQANVKSKPGFIIRALEAGWVKSQTGEKQTTVTSAMSNGKPQNPADALKTKVEELHRLVKESLMNSKDRESVFDQMLKRIRSHAMTPKGTQEAWSRAKSLKFFYEISTRQGSVLQKRNERFFKDPRFEDALKQALEDLDGHPLPEFAAYLEALGIEWGTADGQTV